MHGILQRDGRLTLAHPVTQTAIFFLCLAGGCKQTAELFAKKTNTQVNANPETKLTADNVANSVIKQVTNDLWPTVVIVVVVAASPLLILGLLIWWWIQRQPPSHIRHPQMWRNSSREKSRDENSDDS